MRFHMPNANTKAADFGSSIRLSLLSSCHRYSVIGRVWLHQGGVVIIIITSTIDFDLNDLRLNEVVCFVIDFFLGESCYALLLPLVHHQLHAFLCRRISTFIRHLH
jgi:hypothetical protein